MCDVINIKKMEKNIFEKSTHTCIFKITDDIIDNEIKNYSKTWIVFFTAHQLKNVPNKD